MARPCCARRAVALATRWRCALTQFGRARSTNHPRAVCAIALLVRCAYIWPCTYTRTCARAVSDAFYAHRVVRTCASRSSHYTHRLSNATTRDSAFARCACASRGRARVVYLLTMCICRPARARADRSQRERSLAHKATWVSDRPPASHCAHAVRARCSSWVLSAAARVAARVYRRCGSFAPPTHSVATARAVRVPTHSHIVTRCIAPVALLCCASIARLFARQATRSRRVSVVRSTARRRVLTASAHMVFAVLLCNPPAALGRAHVPRRMCIWSYGVTASSLDSESSDRGSDPRRT